MVGKIMPSLDAMGNIGEFVGGLAVVITLFYLAVQIRQNNSSLNENALLVRAQMKQASSASHNEVMSILLTDEKVRDVFFKSMDTTWDALTKDEQQICAMFFSRAVRGFGDDYYRYQLGVFTEHEWEDTYATLLVYINNTAFRDWVYRPNVMGRDFATYIRQQIEDAST